MLGGRLLDVRPGVAEVGDVRQVLEVHERRGDVAVVAQARVEHAIVAAAVPGQDNRAKKKKVENKRTVSPGQ